MKCLVLAGGRGDRLWPLSRKNYPKQFIQIQKNHSIFQETIARNMPFCDEFIIVTNKEYGPIVENQMKAFQGIQYSTILEEEGRKTTAAIIMPLFRSNMSEIIFVVSSDHLISGEGYKDNILEAKQLVLEANLVTIGMPIKEPDTRFGYIHYEGNRVLDFEEKPGAEKALYYKQAGDYLINSGMFMFRAGDMLRELRFYSPKVYGACREADRYFEVQGSTRTLPLSIMQGIPALPIEKTVFEKTKRAAVVHGTFDWKDIGALEDLTAEDVLMNEEGVGVTYDCENTTIINACKRRAVVANGLSDVIVVNTKDAVYVGQKGKSEELKSILRDNPDLQSFYKNGRITYRKWGSYEELICEPFYRVRKVSILPGNTIYAHKHCYRSELWSLVEGTARITIDGETKGYGAEGATVISIPTGVTHQISNVGEEPLVIIEVATGSNLNEEDMISVEVKDLTERELGYEIEPIVKLAPAYKDYLWGGTKLRTVYQKECDFDIIAESWELSAHFAGQSTIADGKHKGLAFGAYLKAIGKEMLGWKCSSLERFPILVKFIDAREKLSVQVHPDDDYALVHEKQYGKNEMWYVVDALPGAGIYCGFKENVTKEQVEECLAFDEKAGAGEDPEHGILSLLNWIPAKKGDVFFIPAGTVHAIGAGMLVCEIQQSSDCTYRLYDYNRTDQFGMKRELHTKKALEVMDTHAYTPQDLQAETIETEAYVQKVLGRCKYFEATSYQVKTWAAVSLTEESFHSLICVAGKGELELSDGKDSVAATTAVKAGDSFFLPMQNRKLILKGEMEVILTHV